MKKWVLADEPTYLKNKSLTRIVLLNIIKKYENRSRIIKTKNNMSVKSHLSASLSKASYFQLSKLNSKISQYQKGVWHG